MNKLTAPEAKILLSKTFLQDPLPRPQCAAHAQAARRRGVQRPDWQPRCPWQDPCASPREATGMKPSGVQPSLVLAHATGCYSMKEIAQAFNIHYATVSWF